MKVAEKTTHFIGIGGIGMSGLARLLIQQNKNVSGSDIKKSDLTDSLEKMGAKLYQGHAEENVLPDARVVFSTDIKKNNPEFLKAVKPIHRSDLLFDLMKDHKPLLVSGTHGKTTTSALLAHVFMVGKKNPAYAVGGILNNTGVNSNWDSGEFFIAEADESDGTHIKYDPFGLIITNIDDDHLSHFKTFEKLVDSFKTLIFKMKEFNKFFYCGDDKILTSLNLPGISYGFGPECLLRITNLKKGKQSQFDLMWDGKIYKSILLNLIGEHNVLNAAAVFGIGVACGVNENDIREAFRTFKGVKRRQEHKFERNKIDVYDDYAHHPEEIKATLKAFKQAYPDRRIVAAFQPQRYTRTKDCFNRFYPALAEADEIFLTDLYAADEAPIEGIDSENLFKTFKKGTLVSRSKLADELSQFLLPFDLLITMGAGDITRLSSELEKKNFRKLKTALVFGGRSLEHEVSFLSAKNFIRGLTSPFIDLDLYTLSKEGALNVHTGENFLKGDYTPYTPFEGSLISKLQNMDIVIPCLHGPYGEDGTFQGFLEILRVAYVGCTVESAAVAMNKALSKKLCEKEGILTTPYYDFTAYEWQSNRDDVLEKIKPLKYPLFVKPVHLGSSVGVFKVSDKSQLESRIEEAFTFDTHLIVEQGVQGRELEVAVLGSGPYQTFPPGEICCSGEPYDYEGKYGENAFKTTIIADVPQEISEEAQKVALKAFKAIEGKGMARVDLFYSEDKLYFSEINPIPGFTQNSLYPKMCELGGIPIQELLYTLIKEGLSRKRLKDKRM